MYNIDTINFTGPLDLLLTLIQKNKLNICEISISKIADEFLETVSAMKIKDVDLISDFIYISSKLIEIKSKYMLYIKTEEDEESDLVFCLEEYARYKQMTQILKGMYSLEYKFFEKMPEEILIKEELDLSKLTMENICSIINKEKQIHEQMKIRFTKKQKSLTKKIEYIEDYMSDKKSCYFDDLIVEDVTDEKVVSMLGILHLAKDNKINITQHNNFDEISIKKGVKL